MKSFFIKLLIIIIVFICVISCNPTIKGVNSDIEYIANTEFIIDKEVKMYESNDGDEVKKVLKYFEPISIVSNSEEKNGRVKVKLKNGDDGWVDKIFTSIIPDNWIKLKFIDNYYCLIPPNEKFDYKQDLYEDSNFVYFTNILKRYGITFGISRRSNFIEKVKKNKKFIIDYELKNKRSKELNWNKEFTYGEYKINYIMTTFANAESGFEYDESFYYIKSSELNVQKYYCITLGIGSKDKRDILICRKILFSMFKSLK